MANSRNPLTAIILFSLPIVILASICLTSVPTARGRHQLRAPSSTWSLDSKAETRTDFVSVILNERSLVRANDGEESDLFGLSVAVDGVTAVVGARFGNGIVPNSGAAYVYTRTGNVWEIQQKLFAPDGMDGDRFGESVAIHGNTIIVGAVGDANIPNGRSGTAYAFVRSLGEWSSQGKLKAQDAEDGDNFGKCVAVFGDIAVVGANQDDHNGSLVGSAYIFKRTAGFWGQQQRIIADDGEANDQFGVSVSFDGQSIAVGAFGDDKSRGSAYVFTDGGINWVQQAKLIANDLQSGNSFGISVSVDDDHIVVGADRAGTDQRGAAYVFVRNNTSWSQQAKLTPSDDNTQFYSFGYSVGISKDTIIVGSPGGPLRFGRAYLYTRQGTSWIEQRKLLASDGMADDEFGISVGIDGVTAIVGAWRRDVPAGNTPGFAGINQGSAYLFQLPFPQHSNPTFDFDGDGKGDIGVFRRNSGTWYLNGSQVGFRAINFGLSSDLIVPADYDGDQIADIAVFRPATGSWYFLRSSDGNFVGIQFGQPGDLPRPGDFDSDGRADIAVFRPSNGYWYWLNSNNGAFSLTPFGQNGDRPLIADFDGDSKSDVAVFRPSTSFFYWLESSTGQFQSRAFGAVGDLPTVSDYDGDGKSDVAVFRPSTGVWFRYNSSTGGVSGTAFGLNGDAPVVSDFDADGRSDIAIFRPSASSWYYLRSATQSVVGVGFGLSTDQPLPAAFAQ